MGTHTPGPWSFKRCATDPTIFQLLDAMGRVIGHPRRGTGSSAEAAEFEANARLIAAAPDLYAALNELANAVDEEQSSDPDCDLSAPLSLPAPPSAKPLRNSAHEQDRLES